MMGGEDDEQRVIVLRTGSKRRGREYALVLHATGIEHELAQSGGEWILIAPAPVAQRAEAEIVAYARENRGWPPREVAFEPLGHSSASLLVYALALVGTYVLEQRSAFGFDWRAAGIADAAAIRAGEWWRCFTALCLHADPVHLAGNLVFGAFFAALFVPMAGVGRAWFATVAAGGLGNALTAWIQGPEHRSLGASTAVFGALGALCAWQIVRRRALRQSRVRRWAPAIAGLLLLGWLGVGGPRTDVVAHVAGLASGAIVGALLALESASRERRLLIAQAVQAAHAPSAESASKAARAQRKRARRTSADQALLAAAAVLVPVFCWVLAFARAS
jgi:rhomboid protease GluP